MPLRGNPSHSNTGPGDLPDVVYKAYLQQFFVLDARAAEAFGCPSTGVCGMRCPAGRRARSSWEREARCSRSTRLENGGGPFGVYGFKSGLPSLRPITLLEGVDLWWVDLPRNLPYYPRGSHKYFPMDFRGGKLGERRSASHALAWGNHAHLPQEA